MGREREGRERGTSGKSVRRARMWYEWEECEKGENEVRVGRVREGRERGTSGKSARRVRKRYSYGSKKL